MNYKLEYLRAQISCKRAVSNHLAKLISKELRSRTPNSLRISELRIENGFYLNFIDRLDRRLAILVR